MVLPQFFRFHEKSRDSVDLLKMSSFLNASIPSLKKNGYLKKKKKLIQLAEEAKEFSLSVSNTDLTRICNPLREGRILSPSLGIYKRGARNIEKEALVWELSVLIGCDSYIVPTIPLDVHGQLSSFQPFVKLRCLKKLLPPRSQIKANISLPDFWVLSIFAFLIGHSDLNGTNLHHNKNGFVLIDNDCSFPDSNTPSVSGDGQLHLPFQNFLLDLDLAYVSLDAKDCVRISKFLNSLKSCENDIANFFSLSPLTKGLSNSSLEAFWDRFRRLTECKLEEGMSHWDFAKTLFPEHYGNSEEVCSFVKQILGYELGPSSSLCILGPGLPDALNDGIVPPDREQKIKEWLMRFEKQEFYK